MAGRADRRGAARLAALLAAALCAACSGDMAGYSIVTQDRYDFTSCKELITTRNGLVAREKELTALVEKAEAAPGGVIASYLAYRSDLTDVRTRLRLATQAAARQNCDAAPK